jgi:flavoprotein
MKVGKAQGYVLTFRCINCAEPDEVIATHPSENLLAEDEVRARIYSVRCNSCGWRGDACGISAIHISYTSEVRVRVATKGN